MANTVWPGVWPGAAMVAMPGATSAPGSKRVMFLAIRKYPSLVAEGKLQIRRRSVQIGIVHPEFPFRRRYHYLGIWKDDVVVFILEAIDVVWVEMRDRNQIDGFRINACGDEIGA